ncbi:cytochrome P450 [Mycena amicta]|nr:cytochrome P450 [Mycena amicta]
MSQSLLILLSLSLPAVLLYAWTSSRRSGSSVPLPPGPHRKPLIGNILDISLANPWAAFDLWKKRYGDIVYVELLGQKIVVLNSLPAITDLFEKRGAFYSHRPEFTMVGELMGLDQSIGLNNHDKVWRQQRKLVSMALGPLAVKQHARTQEKLAAMMLSELEQRPDNFHEILNLAAARLVVQMTYGHFIKSMEDPYIAKAHKVFDIVSRSIRPGAYLVDFFHCLKHVPEWMPFSPHRAASRAKGIFEPFIGEPYNAVKSQMESGTASPSLVSHLLSNRTEVDGLDYDELVKWSAGTMYGSGVDTTTVTIETFILAMLLHPEVQKKAQAEVDALLKGLRLPTVDDRASLPYVAAVMKEVMRWHVTLPLGFARRADKDDVYNGFLIPKGAILLPNIRGVAHEGEYLNMFRPELHMGGLSDNDTADPFVYAFGFGRRACPGRQLAENSVFIFIASILAVFDITPADSMQITPTFSMGLIRCAFEICPYTCQLPTSHPEPFKCNLNLRTPGTRKIISSRLIVLWKLIR